MKAGILGYGVYLPKYRIKVDDISSVWGKKSKDVKKSLLLSEKSVASLDEDSVTLALESAQKALISTKVKKEQIDLCLVGSESHPYAVNPTSTIVSEFLSLERNLLAADLEFACKAATTGLIAAAGLIDAGKVRNALIIGSDKAQSKPHDILEYTASSASASS